MGLEIIAHRGASYLAGQDNTLNSFKLAIDIGADFVEFDIRRSYDKVLIVYHDNKINNIKINNLTYNEICTQSQKNGYIVPTLEEVLKLCSGKIKLDIELKESGYEKEIIKLVTKYFDYSNFMMKSFIDKCSAIIKYYDPNIKCGLLLGVKHGSLRRKLSEYYPLKRVNSCKADFVSPYYMYVTRSFINRMKENKLEIYAWTINDSKKLSKYIRRNIDGVITDKPDAGIYIRNKINNK